MNYFKRNVLLSSAVFFTNILSLLHVIIKVMYCQSITIYVLGIFSSISKYELQKKKIIFLCWICQMFPIFSLLVSISYLKVNFQCNIIFNIKVDTDNYQSYVCLHYIYTYIQSTFSFLLLLQTILLIMKNIIL